MADDEHDEEGSDERAKKGWKANVVPALIIGAALLIGPKLAGGGGGAQADAESPTTVGAVETSSPGSSVHVGPSSSAGEPGVTSETGTTIEVGAPVSGSDAHWTYEGAAGPDHWGALSPDFVACADGTRQSPIDLRDPIPTGLTDIVFSYLPMDATVVNNGHTIQADFEAGSSIQLDGQRFDLVQFHVHAPSEHTLAGKRYPMEIHLVHRNAGGDLAVVAVLVAEGAENPYLVPFLDALPEQSNIEYVTARPIELAGLLPEHRVVIRYSGSLTTPPCSENVRWNVMSDPIEASAAQIQAFQALYKGNNRPLQPVDNRTVVIDADPQQ